MLSANAQVIEPIQNAKPPLFSIVTPSYNYGQYIRECIESVRQQANVTLEHIIIDACSTDETHAVLCKYPELQVTIEPDEGMSDAINKGFAQARGEWIMWLNADDRLKPGALAEVMRYTKTHPETDVIYGTCDFVDAAGGCIRRWRLIPFNRFIFVHHNCYIPSTATFLKRQCVLRIGADINIRFKIAMDKELYSRLAARGARFSYLPVALADFRIHEMNLSRVRESGDTVDVCLSTAQAAAESEAIRRAYGWTPPFGGPPLRWISDAILYLAAWALKGILLLDPRTRPSALPISHERWKPL